MKTISNNEDLEEALKTNKHILIDFWAYWCGPCMALSPILDQIDLVPIYKINIEESPEFASQFHIMKMPTMIILDSSSKEILSTKTGLLTKTNIEAWIKQTLAANSEF